MSQVTVLWFCIRRGISADSLYNLHLRESEFFYSLSTQSSYIFEKHKVLCAISSNTHPWNSNTRGFRYGSKVMPCVFYLDLRSFIIRWYKLPKIKIGPLGRESQKYARQRCKIMKYETKGKEIWIRNFLDNLLTWYCLLSMVYSLIIKKVLSYLIIIPKYRLFSDYDI